MRYFKAASNADRYCRRNSGDRITFQGTVRIRVSVWLSGRTGASATPAIVGQRQSKRNSYAFLSIRHELTQRSGGREEKLTGVLLLGCLAREYVLFDSSNDQLQVGCEYV